MNRALHSASILASALLLAACEQQALVDFGGGEVELCELSLLEAAPFSICCAGAAIMVLHGFLPPVRRLYDMLHRFVLRQFGKTDRLEERTALLTDYAVWLNVACGICLTPLCYTLHEDIFYPSYAGPFNFGFTLGGLLISALLSCLAFALVSLWAWLRWRRLAR